MIPAKIQFFSAERAVWKKIPAIVQAFEGFFNDMCFLKEKGCIIAGILCAAVCCRLKACKNAVFQQKGPSGSKLLR
jgi:hypothetical protein